MPPGSSWYEPGDGGGAVQPLCQAASVFMGLVFLIGDEMDLI